MKNFLLLGKNKIAFLFFFLFNALCFGANPLSDFKTKADKELESTMKTILGVVNTVSMTIGIAWIIVMILFMKGSPERFKENLKGIIVISVIIGIVYGLSAAYS